METIETQVKERPIPLYQHEVRSILDGLQSQLRRVMKPQPVKWGYDDLCFHEANDGEWEVGGVSGVEGEPLGYVRCPYGAPGDRLWVRETFKQATKDWLTHESNGIVTKYKNPSPGLRAVETIYRADVSHMDDIAYMPWQSPIFMPRTLSRITLEVTDVRVERVQEIRHDDVLKEGTPTPKYIGQFVDDRAWEGQMRNNFIDLWDSINEKRGYGWDVNPWVWVVEFRRVQP